jgi:riboflavin-specific deaminase-like protein
MAMTADGKIATPNQAISSFGSRRDRKQLLELRATADAVMAGARTVDLGQVRLGPGPLRFRQLRLRRGLAAYNLRVIVSRRGSVNPKAEIFRHRFSPIIILTTREIGARRFAALRRVADEVAVFGRREIDLASAMRWLRERWGVKRLLCEGGGELNDALFRAGLVDELHLTLCPKVFGGRRAPTIADGAGVARLAEAARFTLRSARRIGNELFLVYAATSKRPQAGGDRSLRLTPSRAMVSGA